MGIYMRWPDGRAKAFTTSYDDGFQQDAALIRLMEQYGIRGTFNLNGGFLRQEGRCPTEIYKTSGQEIALHGLHHDSMPAMADAAGRYEILREREILEEEYGTVVQGMAYPNGQYSPGTMERLAACGVLYSRTVESTHGFSLVPDTVDGWLRLRATCHHNDPLLPELAERFLSDKPMAEPYLFYLWGHSFELDRNDGWEKLKTLFERIGRRETVWYATNGEIYDYVEAYRRLRYSVTCTRVYNPSCMTVWVEKDRVMYAVEPGKMCELKSEEKA